MKKLMFVCFTLCFFAFTTSSIAQLSVGVESNASFSNMNIKGAGNLINSPSFYTGSKTGIQVSMPFYYNLGFESGLYYHLSGFEVKQNLDFDVFKIPIKAGVTAIPRFQFLEMPLLLNGTIGEHVQLSLSGGPYVGYALDGDIKTRAKFLIDINTGTYDLNLSNSIFNRWEIGLMAKAGLKIPIEKFAIHLNGQFQHGLNDLTDEPILDIRTRRYALGLGAGLSYQF